jgi:hypothetical protein
MLELNFDSAPTAVRIYRCESISLSVRPLLDLDVAVVIYDKK